MNLTRFYPNCYCNNAMISCQEYCIIYKWPVWILSVIDNQKLTAGTQTEPVPSRIDRMPLAMPADTHSAVGADAVHAMHSAAESSAAEVCNFTALLLHFSW